MHRFGKHLLQNQNKPNCGKTRYEYRPLFQSYYALKAKLEIEKEIIRSKSRRNCRKKNLDKYAVILTNVNRRHIPVAPILEEESQLSPIPSSFSCDTLTTGFTVNYLQPEFNMESKIEMYPLKNGFDSFEETLNVKKGSAKSVPYVVKIGSISRRSFTETYLQNYLHKDVSDEGQLHAIKISKHDYDEILTHLALCYTFQVIEESGCLEDRDWSGSYIPSINDDSRFLYYGGYGMVDGVTECNKINLAVKKYQNIDFSNDEAVGALSHMYSLGHLLDGAAYVNKDSKELSVRVVSSLGESDDSESSKFSFR